MTCTLYTNKQDKATLKKFLSDGRGYTITFKDDNIDIINPTIIISSDISALKDYNYAYLPNLNRYYFINGFSSLLGSRTELSLSVDVLMSWQSDILNMSVIADRSTNKGNRQMTDPLLPTLNKTNKSVYRLSNGLFYPSQLSAATSRCYVLTILNKRGE